MNPERVFSARRWRKGVRKRDDAHRARAIGEGDVVDRTWRSAWRSGHRLIGQCQCGRGGRRSDEESTDGEDVG